MKPKRDNRSHRVPVRLGLEALLGDRIETLRGARVGLVCNQASVDHQFRHAADMLYAREEFALKTLFGPQHGIRGDVQDNMIETAHSIDRETGLPVYSLYSETREPTAEMLSDLDVIVFDLQDVGCRIYTFIYTLANCMRAAKAFEKKVLVCDRPNPIGGTTIEGPVLDPEFASFVGQFPLPTRHGMTVGELAGMFNEHFDIGCELEVIRMDGWSRNLWFDDTDTPWVMPSPNMPTVDTAIVFPGTVYLEGTEISEGRGTTRPFEIIGAPYILAKEYAEHLNALELPGVAFRSCGFEPTFQKHARQSCQGVQIHVTDRETFKPVASGIAIVKLAVDLYSTEFKWKEPPYEYVYDKNPFDVIAGTEKLRKQIEGGYSVNAIVDSWKAGEDGFKNQREPFMLYGDSPGRV
jgi:uncharacterized protein YbbC (DUF1343 family)